MRSTEQGGRMNIKGYAKAQLLLDDEGFIDMQKVRELAKWFLEAGFPGCIHGPVEFDDAWEEWINS